MESVPVRSSFILLGVLLLAPLAAHAADQPKPAPADKPALPATPPPPNPAPATPPTAPTPAPAPAATSPTATPAPASTAPTAGSNQVKLRDLERRVDELKEQIFRSKARLNLLNETVLHGVIAGARAIIMHRNEMGSMYTPIKYVYALDGAEIFSKSDDS